MSYQRIVLVQLLTIGVFFSCKKNDQLMYSNPSKETMSLYRIKSQKTSYGDIINYEYDSKGRLTKESHGRQEYDAYVEKYAYVYQWFSDRIIKGSTTFILDPSGRCTSRIENGDTTIYTYSSDGYIIKKTTSGFIGSMVYTNENITKYTDADYKNSYEYNRFLNTIGPINVGISFLGKDSKNLVKTFNQVTPERAYLTNYTYEFDSRNRVSKMIASNGYGKPFIVTYTYY